MHQLLHNIEGQMRNAKTLNRYLFVFIQRVYLCRRWRKTVFLVTSGSAFWPTNQTAAAKRTTDTCGTWEWTFRRARPGCADRCNRWSRRRRLWTTWWTATDRSGRRWPATVQRASSNSRRNRRRPTAGEAALWDWASRSAAGEVGRRRGDGWASSETDWAGHRAGWGRHRRRPSTATTTRRRAVCFRRSASPASRLRSRTKIVFVCRPPSSLSSSLFREIDATGSPQAVWPAATRCWAVRCFRGRTWRRPCGSDPRTGRSAWTRAGHPDCEAEPSAKLANVCGTAEPVLRQGTWTRRAARRWWRWRRRWR